MATTVQIQEDTRRALEAIKSGSETYDDAIRILLLTHPQHVTMAELYRRAREKARPIQYLIERSRQQPY